MRLNMDNKQKKALRELENAFKKCSECSLSFHGIDSGLYVVPYGIYKKHEKKTLVGGYSMICDYLTEVNTYRSYIDSGGF